MESQNVSMSVGRLEREAVRDMSLLELDDQKSANGQVALSKEKRDALEAHARQVARRLKNALPEPKQQQAEVSRPVTHRGQQRKSEGTAVELESSKGLTDEQFEAPAKLISVEREITREVSKQSEIEERALNLKDELRSEPQVPHITARWRLPPEELLDQKLVPAMALQRFDEARLDEQRWFSVTFGLLGIAIGVVSQTLITGVEQVAGPYWFAAAILCGAIVISALQTMHLRRRVSEARHALDW